MDFENVYRPRTGIRAVGPGACPARGQSAVYTRAPAQGSLLDDRGRTGRGPDRTGRRAIRDEVLQPHRGSACNAMPKVSRAAARASSTLAPATARVFDSIRKARQKGRRQLRHGGAACCWRSPWKRIATRAAYLSRSMSVTSQRPSTRPSNEIRKGAHRRQCLGRTGL